MRTYLSIDFDYWRHFDKEWYARRFFKRVWALKRPIFVALHHHHLLQDINRRRLDAVINVDFHSDIVEEEQESEYFAPLVLNEGTWANFVEHQERMTFEWRYPDELCLDCGTGYCHQIRNPFEERCTRWQRVKKKEGLARIPWSTIKAVGVCLSPSWLDNKWAMSYPIKCLGLYDWFGRWLVYDDFRAPTDMDAENGVGIFQPYLTRPKL